MLISTKYRSDAPEIMDDFLMEGEILRDALDKIAHINRLLGGNSITLDGVKSLITGHPKDRLVRIVDVGCGNGAMLHTLANFARKHQLNFELKGIDANAFTIKHAQSLASAYPEISFECADIFKLDLASCDIILCTLTLHHFKDDEILVLMEGFKKQSALGMVINDLHRSRTAYYLFSAICYVFRLNQMSKDDGLTSILRGFKRHDLQSYARQLNLKTYILKWKWAFRYQWIVNTTNDL